MNQELIEQLDKIKEALIDIDGDYCYVTHIHGKVAAAGANKDFVAKCANLSSVIEAKRKNLNLHKEQIETQIRQQNEFVQMQEIFKKIEELAKFYGA